MVVDVESRYLMTAKGLDGTQKRVNQGSCWLNSNNHISTRYGPIKMVGAFPGARPVASDHI